MHFAMAGQLSCTGRIIVTRFCKHDECTRMLGYVEKFNRQYEKETLQKVAKDINSQNQVMKLCKMGGYCIQTYGAYGIYHTFKEIAAEHYASSNALHTIIAFTFGAGIVIAADLILDMYISNKLKYEVSPYLGPIRDTIGKINEESEEVGSLIADPAEVDVA